MKEKEMQKVNGFAGILLVLIFGLVAVYGFVFFESQHHFPMVVLGLVSAILFMLTVSGIVIVKPNEAKVFTLFGNYVGVIKKQGLWLTIPLCQKEVVSLRVANFDSQKLKVNDLEGNPVDVGAVVVYKVKDSVKAVFDVEDYEEFIQLQCEAGLRHIASKHPYDHYEDDKSDVLSLRKHSEEISEELIKDLQERLDIAGVEVLEVRITHLAYSSEIASAMLQRQQAQAILSARKIIVDGAVSMVKSAIDQLKEQGVVELDEEKKAQMVNNLMVAIVSEKGSQPIINAGTVY